MKRFLIILLSIGLCQHLRAQAQQTNTSLESEQNVNTENNTTKINLFDIDFDGITIPITLIYEHNGLKINEKPNSVGVKWKIQEIGIINRIVNDKNDSTPNSGWFNSSNPDFTPFVISTHCSSDCPSEIGTNSGNDYSPDFFSIKTAFGCNFDFLYKKNINGNVIGPPIPVFLSNPNGFKINTTFSNFITNCSQPFTGTVFNILDKFGNNYNYINGPLLQDVHRNSSPICRNNFYLKTISDANNTKLLSIDYTQNNLSRKESYKVGFNGGAGSDYQNNIVNYVNQDYFYVDESRFDIEKITAPTSVVEFKYIPNTMCLDEIEIKDIFGNYITGFKFDYNNQGNDLELWRISKYNNLKTVNQVIYTFEYFVGQDYSNDDGQYEDSLGYNNGAYKANLMPFTVRINGNLQPPGDYSPNLTYAKIHALKKITNQYGGVTEFDYQLNQENHDLFGLLYGGGILISSKKSIPITGALTYTGYVYDNLVGYVNEVANPMHNFCYTNTQYARKFYSVMPELDNPNYQIPGETYLSSMQTTGNFFSRITESKLDLNTMSYLSEEQREFIPNSEGIFLTPLLKRETSFDANHNTSYIKEYTFSYQSLELVNRAVYRTDIRSTSGSQAYILRLHLRPININRIKLTSTKIVQDGILDVTNYTYINSDSKIIRSISKLTSLGEVTESKFFYCSDSQLSSEPQRANLILKNIIGVPLKTEVYKASVKLGENKLIYGNDATTSNLLVPKYLYEKKGDDNNGVLEKKLTYDLYDLKGNILQMTQENSVPMSIIWGYNKLYPVAHIKNVAYNSISSGLITSIETASANTGSETSLILALGNLRSQLTSSLTTTSTYKPLIGVSTFSDPKGSTLFYSYDTFNRPLNLKVKDEIGNLNILIENDYNFKP